MIFIRSIVQRFFALSLSFSFTPSLFCRNNIVELHTVSLIFVIVVCVRICWEEKNCIEDEPSEWFHMKNDFASYESAKKKWKPTKKRRTKTCLGRKFEHKGFTSNCTLPYTQKHTQRTIYAYNSLHKANSFCGSWHESELIDSAIWEQN